MPFRNAQEQGKPLAIKDEGVTIATAAESIDFEGAGVSGSAVGQDVTEQISGAANSFADNESVSGTINGSNDTFTLANAPDPAASLVLTLARQIQIQGVDFTLSGSTITYTSPPSAALSGQPHKASYRY